MLKEQLVELEFTDDDILYYIDDEAGNEIGFAIAEDGNEVEYYYADSAGDKANCAASASGDAADHDSKDVIDDKPFVSREEVAHLKEDLNVIYKENAETVNSLRSIAHDMSDLRALFTGKVLMPQQAREPDVQARAQE